MRNSITTVDEYLAKSYVDELAFELSLPLRLYYFDYRNIIELKNAIDEIETERKARLAENETAQNALEQLKKWLLKLENRPTELSNIDLKEVFLMLRYGEITPIYTTDSQGRIWLKDGDLLHKAYRPSIKYPKQQLRAAMTSDFVRDVADKYKCATKSELLKHFKRDYFADI